MPYFNTVASGSDAQTKGQNTGYIEVLDGLQTSGQGAFRVDQSGNVTAANMLSLVSATPAAGFALQNATPTILTWTAPNDGNEHRFIILGFENVSSNTTAGQVSVSFTDPAGGTHAPAIFGGSQGSTGYKGIANNTGVVEANTTVSVTQTALTGGAATVWIEMWAN